MLLPLIVILACVFAAILQFAAIRSPDTSNLRILVSARRINAAGLAISAAYISYSLYDYGQADNVLCLISGLWALNQILFAMHTFFEPSCTDRLMSAERRKKRRPGNGITFT